MKYVKRVLLLLLAVLLIASTVIIMNGHKLYKSAIEEMSLEDKIEKIQSDPNYTPKEYIPAIYKNAVIAVEDHRYKEHGAIDIISIGRAIWSNIRAGELNEGGSTITQQVAKTFTLLQKMIFSLEKLLKFL
ncbi:MAG: transglycosylase domain-containing protein [Clostridia bacterium]